MVLARPKVRCYSVVSMACTAIAAPAEAQLTYLSCSFPQTTSVYLRIDGNTGWVALRTDQQDSLRRVISLIRDDVVTIDARPLKLEINLKDMHAVIDAEGGGESLISFGRCIKQSASGSATKDPPWPRPARPRGRIDSFVTVDDYPPKDRRMRHHGTARFVLQVGANGRVLECLITGSSGYPDLDEATCTSFTRWARFAPALDEARNPIPSSFSGQKLWRLPPE
jgi:TonB family protein